MNQEQYAAVARQILLMLCGGFVAKGYVDDATLQVIVASLIALGTAGYGIWKRREAGLIQSAANQPSVTKVVASPDMANVTLADNPKVQAG